MDTIISYLNSVNIDFDSFWKAALILLLGVFLISVFGRFVFGKRSALNHAVSSSIGILFIYAISVVLRNLGTDFQNMLTPLPLVSISGEQLVLFPFSTAHYTTICSELLSMIVLAFLVNMADSWLPKGKNIITWLFFRCLTVIIAYLMHMVVVGILATYLPAGFVEYAPVILLSILAILLLTGVLKVIVGALLSTVNPIIGGLYTFFFATVIGKQITKAVLTTVILTVLIIALQYVGFGVISIASAALTAYIPLFLVLIVLWYIAINIF